MSSERLRDPPEIVYAKELAKLAKDEGPKPAGWALTPRAVKTFVTSKFVGDASLIDRAIVTLMGERGLLLVGEPGTAKSMLSELLAAAISKTSRHTIQGTAGTTEDQVKYSWNYAKLLAEGPSPEALVKGPLYLAMERGALLRFEEITRCQPEIQDTLISVLSEKVLVVPELEEQQFAAPGFNIIATANIRDRGVNEMSSALKRRFNFETVKPISDRRREVKLVLREVKSQLGEAVKVEEDVIDLLVTTFQDLRSGQTSEGAVVERPTTVMSTAEAVAVGVSAGLDAQWFGDGQLEGTHVVRQLLGTVLKDNPDDAKKLRQYFDVVVKSRAKDSARWKQYYEAKKHLKR